MVLQYIMPHMKPGVCSLSGRRVMAVFLKVCVTMLLSIRRVSFKSFVTLLKLRLRCHARASDSQYSMEKQLI